jgi:type I restriction enzyme S subunit
MKKVSAPIPIGDVCPVKNRKPKPFAGIRNYYSTGAVGPEGELSKPETVDFENRPSRAGCMPEVGDVGFARMKGTKKVILIDENLSGSLFSTGFCFIIPGRQVLPRFAFYFITSDQFQDAKDSAAGDGIMGGIKNSDAESIGIPVPPLAEQQRIVALLDEAFAGIATAVANAERNLKNARAIFESHLEAVFSNTGEGWVEKTLGDVCEFLNGFAFKSGDAILESQTQLVRMGNLYGNRLDLDRSPVFYPNGFAAEYARYVLTEGDIIMSLTGTTGKEDYGFAVRIPECGHTLLMNQRIMKFESVRRDFINDGYLLHYLRSRWFLDLLYRTANGTRQANLSSVTIKSLPVPLPSLSEQRLIVTQLDALSAETQRLEAIYREKLALLCELKKSLLHEAFSGEL